MSRPLGSTNTVTLPAPVAMTDAERLEFVAKLVLEIVESELIAEGIQ